ncbi:acyltransferase family protein [Thalassotalea sp. PLHSN55]|uniref:acyltransferase family protein n=1 Tax=Thalassotalea sp. PLHSN55 TaxID=3435888 RepID=UPI003F842632
MNKTRFYEIDFLRFFSAFFVVFFHYTFTGYMEGFAPIADFESIRSYSRYAYMGINFFFIISGFVIFMSIENGSARRFIQSRFVRLFPAYWFSLCLTTLVTLFLGSAVLLDSNVLTMTWTKFLANITMLNTMFDIERVDWAYWTLYLELKFYAVVLILLLLKWLKYCKHVLAAVLISSTVALFTPWAKEVDMWVSIFPHWSGYFAAGGVFYLIRRDGNSFYHSLLLILSYIYIIKQSTLFGSLMTKWFAIDFDLLTIALINSGCFAFFCITAFCNHHPLRKKQFYYLGILTYPLYLIHQFIGYMIFNTFGSDIDINLLVPVTLVIMLVLAYLIHIHIELKFAPIFKRFSTQLLKIKIEVLPKQEKIITSKE